MKVFIILFCIVCLSLLHVYAGKIFAVEFTISNPVINSQDISFDSFLSGVTLTNCPDNRCYLLGTLRSAASSKYFGETANNTDSWVDYISTPDTEYIKTNFYVAEIQDGSWSAQLKMRYKVDDPNYQGPGSYDLKVRRYTGKSSTSYAESNTQSIVLTAFIPTFTPTPSPSNTPTPTLTHTSTPTPKPTPTPTISPKPTMTPQPPASDTESSTVSGQQGAVLGETGTDRAARGSGTNQNTVKPWLIAFIFVALGSALLSGVFLWLQRHPAPGEIKVGE